MKTLRDLVIMTVVFAIILWIGSCVTVTKNIHIVNPNVELELIEQSMEETAHP